MKMYRVTIELERSDSPDERGYKNWTEVYQQMINDLEVSKLITIINEPKPVQMAPFVGKPGSIVPQ